VGTLVVDAALIVDAPLPPIWVRQTLAPDAAFDRDAAAVSGAVVTITRGPATFPYVEDETAPGRYIELGTSPAREIVRPNTMYALSVSAPDGRRATARTTTPGRLAVTEWVQLDAPSLAVRQELRTFAELGDSVFAAPENQIVYQDGLLEARFDRDAASPYYHVGLISLDLYSDFVIEGDFLEPEDYEDFGRNNSSPALEARDGFVRLPWFAIYYAGRHKIKVFAVDENWFDLARSSPGLIGNDTGGGNFGGNAGDNFDRPFFHVEGGIGLFGSASVDSIGFVVLPKP
jgi:hypothetical protein